LQTELEKAFFGARAHVLEQTRRQGSQFVQKYELVDPKAGVVRPGFLAAGKPVLLLRLDAKRLHNVPELPVHYVPRPDIEGSMRDALLTEDHCVITASASVAGTAGIGKTTTACWLTRDPQIQTRFLDGIVWLVFGNQGSALESIRELAQSLGVPKETWKTWSSVRQAEREMTERRTMGGLTQRGDVPRVLLVLDDIWKEEHATPFKRMGFAFVLTTRLREVATKCT
jgi:hypothetical protein